MTDEAEKMAGASVPLTIGQRFDIGHAMAAAGHSVEMIQQAAGITRWQAIEFWNKAHPGDLSHSEGLRRNFKD